MFVQPLMAEGVARGLAAGDGGAFDALQPERC